MKHPSIDSTKIDFSKEQRQAPIGLVLFFFDTVRKLIKGIWPFIIILFLNDSKESEDIMYVYVILAASAFIIINSLFSYWFFKYKIVDHVLIVKKGYLKKVRLNIPLDRIQTINTKQNVVQRILGLLSLEIDTAGAKDTELEFIAINKATAEGIETLFNQYKASVSANQEEVETANESAKSTNTLLQLSMTDLLKVGLSENHIKSFFIAFGIIYGFYYQVRDIFQEELDQLTEESMQIAMQWNYKILIGIAIFVFFLSILISFARIIFRFYHLKLSKIEHGLKVQYGLLNTKEAHIPLSKIQLISFHNNPLRRWLKFRTLKIKQAVSSEQFKKTQSIQIPACNAKDANHIQALVLEHQQASFGSRTYSHWFYFFRIFLLTSIPPSVAFYVFNDWFWWTKLAFILLELLIVAWVLLSYKKRYFRMSDHSLELSVGSIAQVHYYLSLYKIQSVRFKQNIFAKRRKVASLTLYTASGTHLNLSYIPESMAYDLYNILLWKVESSQKAWM